MCSIAKPGLDLDSRQLLAGLLQAQQLAVAPQTLANKVRLIVAELNKGLDLKSEVADRVYTKSGCTVANDGTRVWHFLSLVVVLLCSF